jgi:hypothetical protein
MDRMKLKAEKIKELNKLSGSPYFQKMADGILENLDRDFLAKVLATYFYMKSKGSSNTDFAIFIGSRNAAKLTRLSLSVGSDFVKGLLFDKEFRSVIFEFGKKSLSKNPLAAKI